MDWIGAVEREGHALFLTARHDTTAEVPSCPGWDIDELLRHVGPTGRRSTGAFAAINNVTRGRGLAANGPNVLIMTAR